MDSSAPDKTRPTRARRWRHSRTGTAVIIFSSLLFSTTAWISIVFAGSFTSHHNHHRLNSAAAATDQGPTHSLLSPHNRTLTESKNVNEKLTIQQLVFGIAGSSQLWNKRKEIVRVWWRHEEMRGHVWLEEYVPQQEWDETLPPIMISEDTSRFKYTNPTGHPSGLRIARIVLESFRLGLEDVRWFVLGDDDTIFNADNLVDVLSKYDSEEMVYVGGASESHSANTYFSHSMAYGGGGIAISYPLAEAISNVLDDCLDRYHKLYGSDDRLHACISELGVPLSKEPGFHQWDIRGNAYGLLSSHPIAPFVSIHHVEAVNPFYPGLNSLDSLKLFAKAMNVESKSFLQRSICYDHAHRLSFSVALGYAIEVYPNILLPRTLERSEKTYSAWNGISHRNEFDLDTRDPNKSLCKKPVLFFLNDVARQGNNITRGLYRRAKSKDDLKRKVFCFPRSPPLPYMKDIQVLTHPFRENWHLVPRRPCCKLNQYGDKKLIITVGQCDKESLGSFSDAIK